MGPRREVVSAVIERYRSAKLAEEGADPRRAVWTMGWHSVWR
jgi:hypothetical protein